MEVWLATLVVLFIIFFTCLIRHVFTRKSHPPGPLGLPFLGILLSKAIEELFPKLFKQPSLDRYFKQMKEKYGNIWSIEVLGQRIVTLASLDLVKEAFVENAKVFSGRPSIEAHKILCENCGIVFIDSELWEFNRNLTIRALRELGFGRQNLEKHVCDEANELVKYLETTTGVPLITSKFIVKVVGNVMIRIICNETFLYDDPRFEEYTHQLFGILHSDVPDKTLNLWPRFFLSKLGRKLFPKVDNYLKYIEFLVNVISEACRERIPIQEQKEKPDCVLGYFWKYRHENSLNLDENAKFLNIVHSIIDLLGAGIDTTHNLLAFCCVLLATHRDIQADLRREISQLTHDVYAINMDMRKECPKFQSFLDEVQRFVYIVPRVPRRALESCYLAGYEIRSDDVIFADLATISRDPIVFDEPEKFNAYRFMDKARTKYVPNKSLIPFGVGKRICLGEKIATMEMFLTLSRLILRFDIFLSKETAENLENILTGVSGLIHGPLDHELIFKLHAFE